MIVVLKDFTMEYCLVQDSKIDETIGVEIWSKVENLVYQPNFI